MKMATDGRGDDRDRAALRTEAMTRRLVAEGIGTALLLATVVGSGIMGEQLAGGNVAIALLANTLATGAALVALILTFGSVSGAHFNPAVSLADATQGGLTFPEAFGYTAAQIAGAVLGVLAAHVMFAQPLVSLSRHARAGLPQVFSEAIATFGLLSVLWGCSRRRSAALPFAVGAYITSAYWFTASTSFANPAVNDRARLQRYLRGHSSGGRARVHPRADHRRHSGNRALPLARASAPRHRRSSGRSKGVCV
jgi:glycerol uptake facilitator-like aquaporin